MVFDLALQNEMSSISDISGKVYPLCAPKGVKAPYQVYRKANVKFKKTLGGTSKKADGLYEIAILANNYPELQQITNLVVEKALSFLGRNIAINDPDNIGPYIEDITVELLGDGYEAEVELFRANLQIKVNY